MVALQFLVLPVLVRIRVSQPPGGRVVDAASFFYRARGVADVMGCLGCILCEDRRCGGQARQVGGAPPARNCARYLVVSQTFAIFAVLENTTQGFCQSANRRCLPRKHEARRILFVAPAFAFRAPYIADSTK